VDSGDLAMMYQATFVPDFYRVLHTVIHARFRRARAVDRLRGRRRGGELGAHPLRDIIGGLLGAAKLPVLERRLEGLATGSPGRRHVRLVPILTRQSAAVPTEQPQ
jgi:hypothetical protein